MPLNLAKVEKLLYDNKFIINGFYIYNGLCRYLKLYSLETGIVLILFISSEYDFEIPSRDLEGRADVHQINEISFDSSEDVVEKYSKYPDDKEVEEKYEHNTVIDESKTKLSNENLEQELENNYNKKIYLNDFAADQITILKDCYRQLKRVALSVKDLRYNICIIQEKYFCCIEHEDDIVCYLAETQHTDNQRTFEVVAELEYFYEKSSVISIDIESIRKGLYSVLDKNQKVNTENLEKLSQMLFSVKPMVYQLAKHKTEYNSILAKYKNLLKNMYEFEAKTAEDLQDLHLKRQNNYFNDAQFIHQKAALENKLQSCRSVRKNIFKNMSEVQGLMDNLYLTLDRTEFDSSVMIGRIFKNFNDLYKLKL